MHEPLSFRHSDADVVFSLRFDDCLLAFKRVIDAHVVVFVFFILMGDVSDG